MAGKNDKKIGTGAVVAVGIFWFLIYITPTAMLCFAIVYACGGK